MKFRSILAIAALAVLSFTACEETESLGEAKVSVSPAEVSFDATGEKSEVVALTATRDWHIENKPDWVVVNPSTGKASTGEQSVTISVDPNKGNDREDDVIFTIGLAKASLHVKQSGEAGELKKGSGTLEDPFSVAGVIEYVQSLGADVQSTEQFFVKGKISTVTQNYTVNAASYGNARFNISDDGTTANGEFICYNSYYMGPKQKFVAGQTDIQVGDDVIVVGKVVNYKGNTPEFVSGENYLYSLNGTTGTAPTPETPLNPSGTGTKDDPYNVDGVINYVKTLAADAQSTEQFYVKGKISTVSQNYTYNISEGRTYGNARFNISDDGTTANEFICYNCYYFNGKAYTADQTDIKVGDDVIVVGNVVNYKGNTPEFVSGKNHLYSLNGVVESGSTQPGGDGTAKGTGTLDDPYNPAGAAAAVANFTWTSSTEYQKTEKVYVKGKIKSIAVSNSVEQCYANTGDYGNASFYLTDAEDGTGEFYVFRALYLENKAYAVGQTDIKVGDVVVICGLLMNYKGNTPETVANESYLYSLNGETSSEASPVFGVEKTEITVGAAATSATINVTGNVKWTATSENATVNPASGEGKGAITVSFDANTDTENAKTYTVVLSTTEEVATKSYTVTITQGKASAAGATAYTLDGDAIKAAHVDAWSYTSGEKSVKATDGSEWILFNTYASKNQVTVQMNKGKSAYVLTPALPDGMEIKKISVVLNKKNDGTGDMGDRPMDILSADGKATLLDNVTGQTLADGLDVAAGNTQARIICDETSGGAVYITSITVTYGAK